MPVISIIFGTKLKLITRTKLERNKMKALETICLFLFEVVQSSVKVLYFGTQNKESKRGA